MRHWLAVSFVGLGLLGVPAIASAQFPSALPVQITVAPPAPRYEQVPVAANPGQVWVHGHWQWNGSQYVWNAGHFEQPPQQNQVWVPAHYQHNGPYWQMVPGHWVSAGGYATAVAPPPLQQENPGPPPAGGYMFVRGHWQWNGQSHFWVPGHWQAPMQGRTWIPPHWEQRGPMNYFVAGHWQ